MFDSKMSLASRRRIAQAGVVLLVLVVLGGMGAGLASAAPPFTVSITTPVSVSGLDVSISGTADSPSSASHHLDIDWGDGNTESVPLAGNGPWTWGPINHTYAADGTYTITVKLIHSSENGNDAGTDATDSTVVHPCSENCGGDTGGTTTGDTTGTTTGDTTGTTTGGTTTGGSTTGGSTTGGTTTGGTTGTTTTDHSRVLGRVIHRKPLAKTGGETTALAWTAAILLLTGATMRFCAPREAASVTAAVDTDDLVARSLDLVTRLVAKRSE